LRRALALTRLARRARARRAPQTVAFAQLAALYSAHVDASQTVSLALVAAGLALSTAALCRLGLTRTYFGSEMGLVEPKRVGAFPYNVLPHPMALGSLAALAGVQLLPGVRAHAPWLVPTHAALTLLHLAQEVLDIHA
jgi:hypothetical protein